MSISKIAPLAQPPLTNQQLADMALTQWQASRAAFKRGEPEHGENYRGEALRLCSIIGKGQ